MHKHGDLTAKFMQHTEFSDPEYHVFLEDDIYPMCVLQYSDEHECWYAGDFETQVMWYMNVFIDLASLIKQINSLTKKERSKWIFGMI